MGLTEWDTTEQQRPALAVVKWTTSELLVWAYLDDRGLAESAATGLAAGAIAMESAETINPAMSAEVVRMRMGEEIG